MTKHSGAAAARVHLDYGEDQLMIDVTDEGPASDRAPGPAAFPRRGRGLAGMRERAQLYGGDLRAAPTAGGGFQVTARLPLTARPTPAGPAGCGPRAAR